VFDWCDPYPEDRLPEEHGDEEEENRSRIRRELVLIYSDIFSFEDGRSIKASLFLFNIRSLSIKSTMLPLTPFLILPFYLFLCLPTNLFHPLFDSF